MKKQSNGVKQKTEFEQKPVSDLNWGKGASVGGDEAHLAYHGWCEISLPAGLKWVILSGIGKTKQGLREADRERETCKSGGALAYTHTKWFGFTTEEVCLRHCNLLRQQHINERSSSQWGKFILSDTGGWSVKVGAHCCSQIFVNVWNYLSVGEMTTKRNFHRRSSKPEVLRLQFACDMDLVPSICAAERWCDGSWTFSSAFVSQNTYWNF